MSKSTSSSCLSSLLSLAFWGAVFYFLAISFLEECLENHTIDSGWKIVTPIQKTFPDRGSSGADCPAILVMLADRYQVDGVSTSTQGIVSNPGYFSAYALCDIFDHFSAWTYTDSFGGIADPATSFHRKSGNSLEYSTAVASCLGAAGAITRIVAVRGEDGDYFCYPEVLLPVEQTIYQTANLFQKHYGLSSHFLPEHSIDPNGNVWINLDFSADWPGGPYRGRGGKFAVQFPGSFCYDL